MAILDAEDTNTWEGGRSFTLSHLLYRAVWTMVWALGASWTPPQFHGWRRFLVRMFGGKIASSAHIYSSVKIWDPRNLEMGDFSGLGPRVNCYSMGKISLGRYVVVSQGAHLCAGTHDIEDPNFQLITKPIHIGDRAWVAAEAFVGPGVIVNEGAVLAARAVAVKSLEPWTVYGGNPAVPIKARLIRWDQTVDSHCALRPSAG